MHSFRSGGVALAVTVAAAAGLSSAAGSVPAGDGVPEVGVVGAVVSSRLPRGRAVGGVTLLGEESTAGGVMSGM